MPRQPRLDMLGLVHHVIARGTEGRDLFRDDDDREGFLSRLATLASNPRRPQLYAWDLMSNHFHLLLRGGEGCLSPVMRRLMTGHAMILGAARISCVGRRGGFGAILSSGKNRDGRLP